jgi:hypothetical protein
MFGEEYKLYSVLRLFCHVTFSFRTPYINVSNLFLII